MPISLGFGNGDAHGHITVTAAEGLGGSVYRVGPRGVLGKVL